MRQATGLKDNLPTSGPDGQLYIARKDGAPSELWCGTGNGIEKLGESKSGGGLEICDIGMSLYVDETKGLRRYINGQIVDINANTQAFLNRLKEITTLHPSLLCTEDEWQTAKTSSAFGQVGKFVFNYSGADIVSVRLPRVVNIQGVFDLQNLGMTVSAGLPNIEGSFRGVYTPNETAYTGAFLNSTGGTQTFGTSGTNVDCAVTFDASRSSEIYGNSNTVQPEAIQYPYFIQIATGSETENNIINEIELNNPYSLFDSKYSDHELNNLSWLKSEGQWNAKAVYPTAYDKLLKVYNGTETVAGLSVKLSTETYTDYDFVLNTADETFRLPLKTKLASGNAVIGNGPIMLDYYDYDGTYRGEAGYLGKIESDLQNPLCARGSIVSNASNFSASTDPTKSGLELSDSNLYLYYYVGETVQNANLIDAGRIGEQLANKQDKCIHIIDTYKNGTSGYRIWSDGYCEQWGYLSAQNTATITLLKTMANTDYYINMAIRGRQGEYPTSAEGNQRVAPVSTSQIFVATNTTNWWYGTYWEVCGYLAEGEY